MFKWIPRAALLAGTGVAALAMAQPTLAYTDLGTTGTTGAHKLIDTRSSPGVSCSYPRKLPDYTNLWQLKHIYVQPPQAKAAAGQGSEKMGWQFTVQRQESGFGPPGPWLNDYTSPTWFATTDSTHNATFTQEGVGVRVPFNQDADAAAFYRVDVKVFWYKANGKVLGTATMRDEWYDSSAPGTNQAATRHHECYDYEDFS